MTKAIPGAMATYRAKLSEDARRAADERFEEIELLTSIGLNPGRIAEDLGTTTLAIERQAERWDRRGIAKLFRSCGRDALHDRNMARRKPCVDCGTLVWFRSTRCRECELRRRNSGRAA